MITKQTCKRLFIFTVLSILLMGCSREVADPQIQESSRPIIRDNTVYTAKGTLLRGSFIGIEYDFSHDRMITSAEITGLKQNGLNALHVYLENNYTGRPAGYQVERADFIVDEAGRQGLYVIITIGVINYPGDFESDVKFVNSFWEFYAERYKDREHVIFEICNEMPIVEGRYAKVQADAFRIIRKHSPDAMVLFFSFPGTSEMDYLLTVIADLEKELGNSLDWKNEAIAFHGYEGIETSFGSGAFREAIRRFKQAGYPIINTELPNRYENTVYTDTKLLKICEEEAISWICFTEYIRIPQRSIWKGRLEAAQISWQPDFGDWPVVDAIFPFIAHKSNENVGKASAKPATDTGVNVYSFTNNDYVRYERLNFGERNPLSFTAEVKSENGGLITIIKGNENGQILGKCVVPPGDGTNYISCTGYITDYINGISDISLVYEEPDAKNDKSLLLRNWQFDLPKSESYIDPYKIIHAANFPYATDKIKRAISTDKGSLAPMSVAGITTGSEIHFDFLLFDNKDMNFNVRAKTIKGGTIEVYWGDFSWADSELGICEINGTEGEWNDYSCSLRLNEVLMLEGTPTYWDLKLRFRGDASGELFEISEFYFGDSKP